MITHFEQLDLNKQYTYADYLTWTFEDRVELIKGWIHKMSPAPRSQHQFISVNLIRLISNYLHENPCRLCHAPFDVRLTDKRKNLKNKEVFTVVQPDICVVCDLTKIDTLGCNGAPDWIIEILSPGNKKHDLKRKYALYEENGVREYWVVNPEYYEVSVFELRDEKYELRGRYEDAGPIQVGIFEGFEISFEELFK